MIRLAVDTICRQAVNNTEGGIATSHQIVYKDIHEVSYEEYVCIGKERFLCEYEGLAIIVYRGTDNWFELWYSLCKRDNEYNGATLKDIIEQYNNWVLNYPRVLIPRGFRDSANMHWMYYKGVEMRRPNLCGMIGLESGYEPKVKSREEKLREKFSWLSIIDEMTLSCLEELDKWWENLRYKELEEYGKK